MEMWKRVLENGGDCGEEIKGGGSGGKGAGERCKLAPLFLK